MLILGSKNPLTLIASAMRWFERKNGTILVLVSAIHGAASDDMTQPALPLRSSMNV